MSSKPITVLVSVRTKPGMEEAYKKELMDVLKHVFAEPNLLNFKVNQNPHDPTRFMFYETWADRNDFETAQLNRPYRKPYLKRTKNLLAEPIQWTIWETILTLKTN